MKKNLVFVLICTLIVAFCDTAVARETIRGKVREVVMPAFYDTGSFVNFSMKTGTTNCPSGTYFIFQNDNIDYIKAAYIALLTAVATDKDIIIQVDIDSSTNRCYVISSINLLSDQL